MAFIGRLRQILLRDEGREPHFSPQMSLLDGGDWAGRSVSRAICYFTFVTHPPCHQRRSHELIGSVGGNAVQPLPLRRPALIAGNRNHQRSAAFRAAHRPAPLDTVAVAAEPGD